MPTINLTAKGRDQELILAYLTENASDVLADKINNGVPFEKDGKQLVNRKDLNGFMTFACNEARKLADKGSRSAAVEDSVVYGWAIHYFEEDTIEGKLFNPDGTEYKPPAPVKKTTAKPTPKPTPKPKSQFSFFDMLDGKKDEQETEVATQTDGSNVVDNTDNGPSIDEIAESLQQAMARKQATPPEQKPTQSTPTSPVEQKPKNPLYEKYITYVNRYPDSVIAMRVGDFYEVFGKKATLIADKANLTLTGRDMGFRQRIPMVGFPYHAAEAYFKKIRQTYSVVVVDGEDVRKLDVFRIEDIIEGDNELTDDEEKLIDDDLTEAEMRLFDGDIQEPKDVPDTPPKEQPKADCEPDVPANSDSPYDEIALAKVVKILGDTFILR